METPRIFSRTAVPDAAGPPAPPAPAAAKASGAPARPAAPAAPPPAPPAPPAGGDGLPVEIGGHGGPEPTRYGDWEHKGRCTDF